MQSTPSILSKATCFHPSDSDPIINRGDVEPTTATSDSDTSCYIDTDGSFSCYYQPNILDSFTTPSTVTSTSSASSFTHASTTTTLFFSSVEPTSISSTGASESKDKALISFISAWPFDFSRFLLLVFQAVSWISIEFIFGTSPTSWLASYVACAGITLVLIFSMDFSVTMAVSVALMGWLISAMVDSENVSNSLCSLVYKQTNSHTGKHTTNSESGLYQFQHILHVPTGVIRLQGPTGHSQACPC